MGANTVELTDANFDQEVLQSTTPVLVDFWAPWCGPCRQIAPMIDALAGEYKGTVKVGKVNVDENSKYAQEYGIEGIPTLLIFKGGTLVEKLVGGHHPKSKIQGILDEYK